MSFTRFHDDPCRIVKENLETTAQNDYIFNVPGNTRSTNLPFYEDPQIRLQRSGVTLHNNMVNVESMLRNIHVPLNRDRMDKNEYKKNSKLLKHSPYQKPQNVSKTIVSESRTTHPAWEIRADQQHRSDYVFEDPQSNVFLPFNANLNTNLLEKDYYKENQKKI